MSKLKPYPKYKDSAVEWLGEIPEGWKTRKIKYLAEIKTGTTPSTSNERYYDDNEGYLWIKPEDLSEFAPVQKTEKYLTKRGLKVGRAISQPSVQVNCIGDVGEFGITEEEVFSTNQQINSLILKRGSSLNYRYFQYAISTSKDEHKKASLTVVVPILNTSREGQIQLPKPSLNEQERIIEYLEVKRALIESLIEEQNKEIKLLKEYRQKIINQAVTCGIDENGKLRERPGWEKGEPIPEGWKDSGVEWLGLIPEGWEISKIKHLIRLRKEENKNDVEKFLYLGLENVESWTGKIVKKEEMSRYESKMNNFRKGDVLFGKLRPYLAKVYLAEEQGSCVLEFLVTEPIELLGEFLKYKFLSKDFIEIVNNSTYGAKMPRANWDFIGNLKIAYPNKTKQQRITGYLNGKIGVIEKQIVKQEKLINYFKEYKNSLITYIVTGKMDVSLVNENHD